MKFRIVSCNIIYDVFFVCELGVCMYVCMYHGVLFWLSLEIELNTIPMQECMDGWGGEIEAFGGRGYTFWLHFLNGIKKMQLLYYLSHNSLFFVVLILFLHSLYWHYSRWLTWKKRKCHSSLFGISIIVSFCSYVTFSYSGDLPMTKLKCLFQHPPHPLF